MPPVTSVCLALILISALLYVPRLATLKPGMSSTRRQVVIISHSILTFLSYSAALMVVVWFAGDQIPRVLQLASLNPVIGGAQAILSSGGLWALTAVVVLCAAWGFRIWLHVKKVRRKAARSAFSVWSAIQRGVPPRRTPDKALRVAAMPQNASEAWTKGVFGSMVIGYSEELVFRVGLPALFLLLGNDVMLSLVASAVVFGFFHSYQGYSRVLVTAVMGLGLSVLYVVTGDIVLCMIVHAVNNMIVLTIYPVIARRFAVQTLRTLGPPR